MKVKLKNNLSTDMLIAIGLLLLFYFTYLFRPEQWLYTLINLVMGVIIGALRAGLELDKENINPINPILLKPLETSNNNENIIDLKDISNDLEIIEEKKNRNSYSCSTLK